MQHKIAIIGMSGLFPGSSTNEAFWQNLMAAKDLTGLASEKDFGVDPQHFYQEGKGVVDKCYSLRGGYIRDFEFDASGYQLPADFLSRQDQLYQWSLFVAKEALRDSGYLSNASLEDCGVVLGNLSFPTPSSHKLLSSVYSQTTESALQQLFADEQFAMEAFRQMPADNEVLQYTPSEMVAKALGLGAT
ncbi:MAG: beta-ketoacyl synthase N-terminal-like domain-containing protein, partial [Bacteroidota bacterium]